MRAFVGALCLLAWRSLGARIDSPPEDTPHTPQPPRGAAARPDHTGVKHASFTQLSPENWEATVESSDNVWVVKTFSGMCTDCQAFAPTFWEIADRWHERVHFGTINFDTEEGFALARRLGVHEEQLPRVQV